MTTTEVIKIVLERLYEKGYTKTNLNYDQEISYELLELLKSKTQKGVNKNKYIEIQNRKYLKSKSRYVDFIKYIVEKECGEYTSFFDVFSGTGIVANSFNQRNIKVIVNDILKSNYCIYKAWLSNEKYDKEKIKNLIEEFNGNEFPKLANYISQNFTGNYFTYENALKIGWIRNTIKRLKETGEINEREEAILLTSLLYAIDKVASICSSYDNYNKLQNESKLYLSMPRIDDEVNIDNEIYCKDANELVREIEADIAYLDPPYNSRQYCDLYHLLENIVGGESYELEGKALKFKERVKSKSKYSTAQATAVFKDLIYNLKCKYILVSYTYKKDNDTERSKNKISYDTLIKILKTRGEVKVFEKDGPHVKLIINNNIEQKELLILCNVEDKQSIELLNEVSKDKMSYYLPKNINRLFECYYIIPNYNYQVNYNELYRISDKKELTEFYTYLKDAKDIDYIESRIKKIRLNLNLSRDLGFNLNSFDDLRLSDNYDYLDLFCELVRRDTNNLFKFNQVNARNNLNITELIQLKNLIDNSKHEYKYMDIERTEDQMNEDDFILFTLNYLPNESSELDKVIKSLLRLKSKGKKAAILISREADIYIKVKENKLEIVNIGEDCLIMNYSY
ncbi:DNA adenine methylase [Cetobacterium somerae]|uniref:DNA adenine methylase n=1 Tax=Cetobacterium somerae TaxID=188913 RepID=UPI003892518C